MPLSQVVGQAAVLAWTSKHATSGQGNRMAVIAVDPQGLVDCAGHVARAQGDLLAAADAAAAGLAGSGGMAGNDPAGTDWAAAYDPAAARLLGLAAEVGNRLGDHVHALNQSAAAYHATEGWFGGDPAPLPTPAQAWPEAVMRSVPEARGGLPIWHDDPIVQAAVALTGTVWPNGSTERLGAAAMQWSQLASCLAAARTTAMTSAAGVLATMSGPMAAAAADRTREFDTGLSDLAAGATELSTACRDLAGHIEEAHREAQQELVNLGRDAAITAAVSAGLSFVTFGAGTLVGGAAATARVVAAGGRLASLFQRLASLARAVAGRITKIKEALDGLAARMSQWVTGRLPQPVRRLGEGAQKVTEHWLFTLATDGPLALAGKIGNQQIAALAGKLGKGAAERSLVLGFNHSSTVRTTLLRATGGRSPSESGQGLAARDTVRAAMENGGETAVARAVRRSEDSVAEAASALLPKPELPASEEGIPAGAEGGRPRIAEVLGLPEGAWPSVREPEPISLAPGVVLNLASGTVTGPNGFEAQLSLPGSAGSELSALGTLAEAATLEDNYWAKRLDAAAAAGDVTFTFGQGAGAAAQQPAADPGLGQQPAAGIR